MVVVHGINSKNIPGDDESWISASGDGGKSFTEYFHDRGFRVYGAHHGDLYSGNGNIERSWRHVCEAINGGEKDPVTTGREGPYITAFRANPYEEILIGDASFGALNDFRTGLSHRGKYIAIQKADVVAHSYGGLLTRWYTKMSDVYGNYQDVRKIITLGTPHRGSPITNMMCEVYKNPIIFDAEPGEVAPNAFFLDGCLGEFAETMDTAPVVGSVRWLKSYPDVLAPNTSETADANIVPALHVISCTSHHLTQLNTNPFVDDILYGSIVGIDSTIDSIGGTLKSNSFHTYRPDYETPFLPNRKSYCNFYSLLDGKDWFVNNTWGSGSDAIVPEYSQTLPAMAISKDCNHLEYNAFDISRSQIAGWLIDYDLPSGIVHRVEFDQQEIPKEITRNNVYEGANMMLKNSGIYDDAIMQVKLEPADPETDGGFGTFQHNCLTYDIYTMEGNGGLFKVTCTGTAVVNQVEHSATIVNDLGLDTVLTSELPVSIIRPADADNLAVFSAVGYLGRDEAGNIIGKDGHSDFGESEYYIGFELNGLGNLNWKGDSLDPIQSPPSVIKTVGSPVISKIIGPGVVTTAGDVYTLRGAVQFEQGKNGVVKLYRSDGGFDSYMGEVTVSIRNPNALDGAMMPYEKGVHLLKNNEGKLELNGQWQHAVDFPADVYQGVEINGTNYTSEVLHLTD